MLKSILDYVEYTNFNLPLILFDNYIKSNEIKIDKPLPGLSFNNSQLYWLSLAHSNCVKTKKPAERLALTRLQEYFEATEEFHQSFGCKFPEKTTKDIEGVTKLFMEVSVVLKKNLYFIDSTFKNFAIF